MTKQISVSCLGKQGRFGNQLWQYAFAKTYALENGFDLQVPSDWMGRKLFNITDPPLTEIFPKTELDELPIEKHSIDLNGYYQHQRFADCMDVDQVKAFFKFKDIWLDNFSKSKEYYIVCHFREGDFNILPQYCTIKPRSYMDAARDFGYNTNDVVCVAEGLKKSEDSRNYSEDKTYGGNIDFLYDFFLLMNADIIFRSNSTFSWWAAFLSGENTKVYSPIVQGLAGQRSVPVKFVEGNWPCHMEIDERHSDIYFGK